VIIFRSSGSTGTLQHRILKSISLSIITLALSSLSLFSR
jgi:hypothetical protein